jgi:hypothetical protein
MNVFLKTSNYISIGFVLVLSVISCSPNYYIPNVLNTPLLKEKGELQVSTRFSMTQMGL